MMPATSDRALSAHVFFALKAKAHRSLPLFAKPTYVSLLISSDTGEVSVSALLSPPPSGPVAGLKVGQIVRSQSLRQKSSTSCVCIRLLSVQVVSTVTVGGTRVTASTLGGMPCFENPALCLF